MAPFTPLSAPPRPRQHNERQSVAPIRTGGLLSAEKLAARREPFVTNLRGGGMAPSFDLFPATPLPPHTGYFSRSHFSDVTKVIQCLCH